MKKINSVKDLSVSCAGLAAARSLLGSDSPPDCHSIPRSRFATSPRRRGFYRRAVLAPTATYGSRKGREGRGGFTMVELVVALVIIAIVSLATVSLIITQNNMNQKATQVIEATNVAENAIECFRFAVNDPDTSISVEDKFEIAFGKTLGENYDFGDAQGEYIINKHGATITIEIDGNKITITAIASDGDIIIDNKSYSK